MNVDRMNFDEKQVNFINHDNSTKLYKQKITNSTSEPSRFLLFSFCSSSRQMEDLQRRRAELLQEIKHKDRRAKHFMKDKQTALNLVCTFFIDDAIPSRVIDSLDRWLNHHKIFENIYEKHTKISMKWQRKPNLPVMFWLKKTEYLSIDVICNHPFEHENLSLSHCLLFICTHSTVCHIQKP